MVDENKVKNQRRIDREYADFILEVVNMARKEYFEPRLRSIEKHLAALQMKYDGMKYKVIYKLPKEKHYECPVCGNKIKAEDVEPDMAGRVYK